MQLTLHSAAIRADARTSEYLQCWELCHITEGVIGQHADAVVAQVTGEECISKTSLDIMAQDQNHAQSYFKANNLWGLNSCNAPRM